MLLAFVPPIQNMRNGSLNRVDGRVFLRDLVMLLDSHTATRYGPSDRVCRLASPLSHNADTTAATTLRPLLTVASLS